MGKNSGVREKLMVFGNDYPTKDWTPIRDYIHVIDLAKAHVIAVKRLLSNQSKSSLEYYNLGTGDGYSVLDVINPFSKAFPIKATDIKSVTFFKLTRIDYI